jgi:alpha,alpha-trehalase
MNKVETFDTPILLWDVQMQRIFPDGKTFPDCLPKYTPVEISKKYMEGKDLPGFSLVNFVHENFELPAPPAAGYISQANKTVEENIEALWPLLTRQPDKENGSLIPLPHPYIVPGGRFGEIYYWDSYFTMLGLAVSGKNDMLENMVNNFSYLIETLGYIPNGNRTYFIGRSQPPFYSLMVKLLAGIKGNEMLPGYLPALEKEYRFWMKGADQLTKEKTALFHAVRMPDGEVLNRHWDENNTPRPESLREDVELSQQSAQEPRILFRHLRAGAESGWDYSSRWFKEKNSFVSIHTTEIVPVDLNCLIFHLEQTLAEVYQLIGEIGKAKQYDSIAEKRKEAIQKYCWNENQGFYFDYYVEESRQKQSKSLAGVFPLVFNMATEVQAKRIAVIIEDEFLKTGGLVSTLETTGQQWDAPNGWAPLQWTTITGLENYGYPNLAKKIARRWLQLNIDVFNRTGKLMEKYNVIDTQLKAGGGEYPGQDGFGWTNGVFLTLIKKYGSAD